MAKKGTLYVETVNGYKRYKPKPRRRNSPEPTPITNTPTAPKTTPPEKTFTLEKAFTFDQRSGDSTLDTQKALLSASFLLEWASDVGGDDVEASLAFGLANVLQKCAADVARHYWPIDKVRDAVELSGGDVRKDWHVAFEG
jgi:hypothetical protein